MWPVGDKSAAEFADYFYQNLSAELDTESGAMVSEVIRRARQSLGPDSAPTFLSYVYYGDPALRIVRSKSDVLNRPDQMW